MPLHTVARALLIAAALLHVAPAGAELLLNEVFYDPEGADEGLEFVELWNPDSVARSLKGIAIESGDGSRLGAWTPIYLGSEEDSVPPRRAFLIPAAALLEAIQNGPDALRLRRGEVSLDLLGYGALTAAEHFVGAPAADAPSGESLARVRDGFDSGSNAVDWAPEPAPTPGRANHPDVRLTIQRESVRLSPEVPWPGEVVTLHATVANSGRMGIPGSRWKIEIVTRSGISESKWPAIPVAACPGIAIDSGGSAGITCAVTAPAPGRFDLRAMLRDLGNAAPLDDSAIADTVTIASRVTAGKLVVHEFAFKDRGAGEWVELLAREDVPDLGRFALTDAGGRAHAIDRGPSPRGVRAGALLVIAESPELVRATYAIPESVVLGCLGGWPALNDTDGEDGSADHVRVVDEVEVPSDAVPYRAGYIERGASVERLGESLPSANPGSWSESIAPRGGTPGRPNSVQAPRGGIEPQGSLLLVGARVLRRPRGAPPEPVVLAFGEAARGFRVRVLVHDLLGRQRRRLVDGQRVLGLAAFVWDGRDDAGSPVPAGIYIVRAETIPDSGEPSRSGSLALSVVDRWAP